MPLPGAKLPTPTAIHAHCLLLYFQAVRMWGLYVRLRPAAFLFCSFDRLLFVLRFTASPPDNRAERSAHAHDKMDTAIGNSAQHRFGVRMGYRWNTSQRTQDMTGSGRAPVRTSEPLMSTAFHAHCLLLYCVQPVRRGALNLLFECDLRLCESLPIECFSASCRMTFGHELIGSCRTHAQISQCASASLQAGSHPATATPIAGSGHRRRRLCRLPR